MAVERRKLRRSTRLLQLFSLMLMGAGAVCLLPLPSTDFWTRIGGVLAIASGSAGVVGLAFTWYRALVAFTACSWGAALLSVYFTTSLVLNAAGGHPQISPFPWMIWVGSLLIALPPSILSSTMHILRVWRPQPMVSSTTEPLVNAAADPGDNDPDLPPADEPAAAKPPPSWPPAPPAESAAYVEHTPAEPSAAARPQWPPVD